MSSLVLIVRFLLEATTVIGLFFGVIVSKGVLNKVLYVALSIVMVVAWAKYGAPKSPTAFIGIKKFLLELSVFGIGTIGFYNLYGKKIGTIYAIVVLADLILMYVLGLQGN